jgi:hypothetical protein
MSTEEKMVSSSVCFTVPKGIFKFSQVYVVEDHLPNQFVYFSEPLFLSGRQHCTFPWVSVKCLERPGFLHAIILNVLVITVTAILFFKITYTWLR